MAVQIHPSVDNGVRKGSGTFAGGTLVCKCKDKPVKVGIKGDVAHNHACGCSKCWKPEGATFAVIAVVPRENVTVRENGDKLKIVDTSATIQRHACKFAARTCSDALRINRIPSMAWTLFILNCSRKRARPRRHLPRSCPLSLSLASILRRCPESGRASRNSDLNHMIVCRPS